MKTHFFILLVAMAVIAGAFSIRVQAQNQRQTPGEALEAIRASNRQQIEQQEKTLERLGDLEKAVQQLKVLSKRS